MGNNDYRLVTHSALNAFITSNGASPKVANGTARALVYEDFTNETYAPLATATSSGVVVSNYTGAAGGAYTSKQNVIEKDVTWFTYDAPTPPTPGNHSVTWSGQNASISGANSVADGGTWTGTITPSEGYTITSVTATMGGTDKTVTVNGSSLTIENITADVVITWVATANETPTPSSDAVLTVNDISTYVGETELFSYRVTVQETVELNGKTSTYDRDITSEITGTIEFSIADTSIATVDTWGDNNEYNGALGVAIGETTYTVTIDDPTYGQLTGTANVTVLSFFGSVDDLEYTADIFGQCSKWYEHRWHSAIVNSGEIYRHDRPLTDCQITVDKDWLHPTLDSTENNRVINLTIDSWGEAVQSYISASSNGAPVSYYTKYSSEDRVGTITVTAPDNSSFTIEITQDCYYGWSGSQSHSANHYDLGVYPVQPFVSVDYYGHEGDTITLSEYGHGIDEVDCNTDDFYGILRTAGGIPPSLISWQNSFTAPDPDYVLLATFTP